MAATRRLALDLDVLDGVIPARPRASSRPAMRGVPGERSSEDGEQAAVFEVSPAASEAPRQGFDAVATLPASPAPVARAQTPPPRALTPVPPMPAIEPVATLPASPAPVASSQRAARPRIRNAEPVNATGPGSDLSPIARDPIAPAARHPAVTVQTGEHSVQAGERSVQTGERSVQIGGRSVETGERSPAAPARSRRIGYAALLAGAAAAALLVAVWLVRAPSQPAPRPPTAGAAIPATPPRAESARAESAREPSRAASATAAHPAPAGETGLEILAGETEAPHDGPDAPGEPAARAVLPAAFARGGRSLRDSARPAFEAFARAIAECERTIVLTGHTCACGDADINRALGLTRARDVADALVARGVARERIETRSAGEAEPAEPGNTSAAHAHNRRVVATCE